MANPRTLFASFSLFVLLIALVSAQNQRDCRDQYIKCKAWAANGQCYENPSFMHVYCPDTCGLCKVFDDKCTDHDIMCAGWAQKDECAKNKPYMEMMCARACNFCNPAQDHSVPHVHTRLVSRIWKQWSQNNLI